MTAVSGLRYYLACAVAAGALAVLISWRLLPDPQLKDYALLIAEVGIGAAIALAVYGISRKNENKLREIAADARRLAQMQADAGRHMELAADRRLEAVLDEICKAADEVAKSKRSYDAGAKRHYSKEIRARCADLAKVAKELTDPPRSVYWAASLYKFRELYGICEKGPSFTDGGVDVSFCEVAKAKARERLEELRGRPGPTPGAQNGDGGRTGLISVSTDRAVYPPRSTIYARAGTSPSLRGKRIRYEIRDQAGAVVASLNLDPISWQDSDPARDGISEASFKMAGSSWAAGEYTVKAICGLSSAQDGFSVARHEPSIESDKDVYVAGSDMVITVTDPDADRDGNAVEYAGDRGDSKLVVETRHGRTGGHRLQETGLSTGTFKGTVKTRARKDGPGAPGRLARRLSGAFAGFGPAPLRRLGPGSVECGRGEKITLRYTNGAGTAVRTVRTSDSGAALDLDREAYTCTDRVRMTVVAPDLAGGAPAKGPCRASIGTSIGRLSGYALAEREPGSGVFEGSVSLTGFPGLESRLPARLPFGATRGRGPDDGLLACTRDDEVEVIVEAGGKLYRKAAPTGWNQGRVDFLAPSYAIGDSAALMLVDPDMSLDPDARDAVSVRVSSDSDGDGIEVSLQETGPASGAFYGEVTLDYRRSSQQGAALLVSNGDTIRAEYIDVTPPDPSGPMDRNLFASTSIISADRTAPPPLERLEIESISASPKTGPGPLAANEPASIRVAVGGAKDPYSFTVILQISDSDGAGPGPLTHPARIYPQQTFECEFRWTPPRPGRFVLEVFLWKSIDDMMPFCPPKEVSVDVR